MRYTGEFFVDVLSKGTLQSAICLLQVLLFDVLVVKGNEVLSTEAQVCRSAHPASIPAVLAD